ncbi:hypothetical protein RYX36_036184 [Vicia faba]
MQGVGHGHGVGHVQGEGDEHGTGGVRDMQNTGTELILLVCATDGHDDVKPFAKCLSEIKRTICYAPELWLSRNVENNQFSGSIPPKLLSIPNFSKDGNQFTPDDGNATIAPARPPHSPTIASPSGTVVPGTPFFGRVPPKHAKGPTASKKSSSEKSKTNTKRVVWITISCVLGFIILALALVLFLPRCSKRERVGRTSKQHLIGAYGGERTNPWNNGALVQPPSQTEKGKYTLLKGAVVRPKENRQAEKDEQRMETIPKLLSHEIDMGALDLDSLPPSPPPPPPPPPLSAEKLETVSYGTNSFYAGVQECKKLPGYFMEWINLKELEFICWLCYYVGFAKFYGMD